MDNQNKKLRVAVLISGKGTNLQSIIDHCKSGQLNAQVCVVISNKKDAYGLKRAQENDIPDYFLDPAKAKDKQDYDEQLLQLLQLHETDLVVLAGYMRVIQPFLIRAFPRRIINLHPSLLPLFKGSHAVQQALDAGAKETGCTVHFASEELDAGETIMQAKVPILAGDSEQTLQARIQEKEHEMLPKAIQLFAEGKIK